MTRTRSKWARRAPDKAKLVVLGGALGSYLLAQLYTPWAVPLFEPLVDGDSSRGNRLGFLLAISSLYSGLILALVASHLWRSFAARRRFVGAFVGAAAIVALSLFSFGLPGRGSRSASEQALDRALPGVQDGTIVGFLVSVVVGAPLFLFVWNFWYRRRRSIGESRQ